MFTHAMEVKIRTLVDKVFEDEFPHITPDYEMKIGKTARWMFANLVVACLCEFEETYVIEYLEALLIVKCFENCVSYVK